jgi:glycosyltransferase involved in cell wall biosynthesis
LQVESVNAVEAFLTQGKKPPKVSVCVVTYNQEKYIAQCLQSIVDQETDFDFEIIVGDDCSTDGTREIVREFAGKYPEKFRLFLHEKNIGAYQNFHFVHEQTLGQYVAHVDGDDYALPGKLQAQANLLDQDKSCNLVWTPVLIETAPGRLHEQNEFFKRFALTKIYTRADLIKYGTIGTNSSKMYRRQVEIEALPPPNFELIDYFVNVIQVGGGIARFAGGKPFGVYRLGIGIASSGNKTKNLTLQSIEYFAKAFPQYRLECNIASTFRLLSDIKNNRLEFKRSLKVFVKTFHWQVFSSMIGEWRFMMCLTLKSKND